MSKVLIILTAIFFAACTSNSVPKEVIPPEKMKLIVYDLVRADEWVNSYVLRDTSLKNREQHIKMYEQVFLIHKVSRDDFYRSFKYYQEHPNVNRTLFDSVLSYTSKQRTALYERKASDTLIKIDTAQ